MDYHVSIFDNIGVIVAGRGCALSPLVKFLEITTAWWTQGWKVSLCFARVVGRSLPSGSGLPQDMYVWNLYRKLQFIGILRSLNTLRQ